MRVDDVSYAEYLAFERDSEAKHEYVNGQIYAMSGGTPEHGRLAWNLMGLLHEALRGRPCTAFTSDVRVRIPATGRATYPDVSVVCGKLERDTEDADAITNPIVLVEVLSPSTESSDRGDKFLHYRRLPSLREYVLVAQDAPRIEVFSRGQDERGETWVMTEAGPGQVARLPSLGVELAVDDVYRDPLA